MRSIVDFVNGRLGEMPHGLRVLTRVLLIFAIIIPVFMFLVLATHGRYSYFVLDGKQVSYDEFWRRGGFLIFFLIGIYSAILVYGFLRASRWSRPLFLLPFVASFIWGAVHHAVFALYDYLSSLLAIALAAWYLFFRQTVKDYYARPHEPTA